MPKFFVGRYLRHVYDKLLNGGYTAAVCAMLELVSKQIFYLNILTISLYVRTTYLCCIFLRL